MFINEAEFTFAARQPLMPLSHSVRSQYGQALVGANPAMYGSMYNDAVGVVPQGAQGMVVNHGGLVSNYGGNVQNLQVWHLSLPI